jgi:hypothetical protein
MNEAVMPSVEATARSTLPVTMISAIGSIISPISIKSDDARKRLRTSRKYGDNWLLTTTTNAISTTRNHSQRSKRDRIDRRGGSKLIGVEIVRSAVVISPLLASGCA